MSLLNHDIYIWGRTYTLRGYIFSQPVIVPPGLHLLSLSPLEDGLFFHFAHEVISLRALIGMRRLVNQDFQLNELVSLVELIFENERISLPLSSETLITKVDSNEWFKIVSNQASSAEERLESRRSGALIFIQTLKLGEVRDQMITDQIQQLQMSSNRPKPLLESLQSIIVCRNAQLIQEKVNNFKRVFYASLNKSSFTSTISESSLDSCTLRKNRKSVASQSELSQYLTSPSGTRLNRMPRKMINKYKRSFASDKRGSLMSSPDMLLIKPQDIPSSRPTQKPKIRLLLICVLLLTLLLLMSATIVEYVINRNPCKRKEFYNNNLRKCSNCSQLCSQCIGSPWQCLSCQEGQLQLAGTYQGKAFGSCQN